MGGAGEKNREEAWQRMKREMINLKCECLQHKDFDGLSSFIFPMHVCERKMLCVIVFAHIHPSVCTFSSKRMNMHVCVHTWNSVETDHPMIGDHWQIEQIFHTHVAMEI